jgi:hypothetical protein
MTVGHDLKAAVPMAQPRTAVPCSVSHLARIKARESGYGAVCGEERQRIDGRLRWAATMQAAPEASFAAYSACCDAGAAVCMRV